MIMMMMKLLSRIKIAQIFVNYSQHFDSLPPALKPYGVEIWLQSADVYL